MSRHHGSRWSGWRRLCLLCGIMVGFAAVFGQGLQPSSARAQAEAETLSGKKPHHSEQYTTTYDYVINFYPLWFTYYQSQVANRNRLVGPDRISPLYHIVVAINDDTLYASTFVDVGTQPLVVTIPPTLATYSVLVLDTFGNVFDVGIPNGSNYPAMNPGGTFVLYGPDYTEPLPPEVTPIALPLNFMVLIFRVDKFAPDNSNLIAQAEVFRASVKTQPLCGYTNTTCPAGIDPAEKTTLVVPELAFSEPFKTAADDLIARDPIAFLKQLQTAVASSQTPPLSLSEEALSDKFNLLFGKGNFGKNSDFAAGAQAAHTAILEIYLTHLDKAKWIHFTNMGDWGDAVLDRASITEFIQYGNGIKTAAYYHTFREGTGSELDGKNPHGYILKFPPGGLPPVERFWSITAYTPEAIELVANPINKYVIGSYTEGLTYNQDTSLSIYLATKLPPGVPLANWLPVPDGKFNIMLRVYGVVPNSNVANNMYVPPGIQRRP
jgi:hypothetical protein